MKRLTLFLQTGRLLCNNKVQSEFHRKSSEMWLGSKAPENKLKTKIQRGVKMFYKLLIFWFVTGFSDIFTVRA